VLKKSMLAIAVCAAVGGLSAGPAMAGEVTGSGKNDDPGAPLDGSGPNGPGGQSQSFGQENKLGLADPHEGNPGTFCNPNRTPLPPQPNRDK
jgi:hypothetical protein